MLIMPTWVRKGIKIMLRTSVRCLLVVWFVITFTGWGAATTTEKLSVVQGSTTVGSLSVITEGATVNVEYAVNENGRGPKHHETIRIGPNFIPIEWTVSGTSLMGGPVSERYSWQSGEAAWTSQADSGKVPAAKPLLYIVNDDSPWALVVYARALLKAPGHTLEVLPSGTMKLTQLRDTSVGEGKDAIPVTVYRIDGVKLEPNYIMLDRTRRLFSAFGGESLTVRQGREKDAAAISKIADALGSELAHDQQHRLAHHFDAPLRIRNVRIFDPRSGELSVPSTVVIMRGRITEILPVVKTTRNHRTRFWWRAREGLSSPASTTCTPTRPCNRVCFTLRLASLRHATWGMTTVFCSI